MKTGKIATELTVGICLFLIISAAYAVNWVSAQDGVTLVDVNSIRKGTDGLIYYTFKYSNNVIYSTAAFDCQNGIDYDPDEPDWRSKGVKVKPNTSGDFLMTFICSRVR